VNQTSFLWGTLVFAFLFFVTVRGDLGKWLGLLGFAGTGAGTAAPQGNVSLGPVTILPAGSPSQLTPPAPVAPVWPGG
jgi:hypothetical protein